MTHRDRIAELESIAEECERAAEEVPPWSDPYASLVAVADYFRSRARILKEVNRAD